MANSTEPESWLPELNLPSSKGGCWEAILDIGGGCCVWSWKEEIFLLCVSTVNGILSLGTSMKSGRKKEGK